MDIDLLAKMVKNLILDNDRVVLPGIGCFVAEVVPSTFSDKGYTINPPYRRLYFRSKPDEGNELIELYAKVNDVPMAVAENVVRDFLTDLRELLYVKKTVMFPGLGRLRATKENDVFFVADEDLDIYPAGFGLEPISLKTHSEESLQQLPVSGAAPAVQETQVEVPEEPEQLLQVSAQTSDIVPAPEPAPVPAPEPDPELAPVSASEPAPELAPESVPEPISAPIPEPAPEPTPEPAPESSPEPAAEPEYEDPKPCDKGENSFGRLLRWLSDPKRRVAVLVAGGLVLVIILFFLMFVVLSNMFPEWMDSILYTSEELEILNRLSY